MSISNNFLCRFMKDFLNIFIGTLIWVFLFIPIFLPFGLLRLFIHFIAKIFRPDLIPITNPMDSLFSLAPIREDKNNVTDLIRIDVLDGKLDVQKYREHFYATLLSNEQLRKQYQNLYCYFVQWMLYCFKKPVDSIDLEEHIQEYKLTPEEESNVEVLLGRWMSRSDEYKPKRPKWNITIFHVRNREDLESGRDDHYKTFVILKIDHALCDGYSVINIMNKLGGIENPPNIPEETSCFTKKVKSILFKLTLPKIALDFQWNLLFSKEIPYISKRGSSSRDAVWRMSFANLDLKALKKVRSSTKAHMSVVIGMLQVGAIRKYLMETERIKSEDELPENTFIQMPFAIPNHPAMIEGNESRMANHFSGIAWKVPIRTKKSGVERVFEAERSYMKMHEIGLHQLGAEFLAPIYWTMPSKMYFLFRNLDQFFMPSPQFLTPVMQTKEYCSLMGLPVQHVYGTINISTIASWMKLIVMFASVGDRCDLTVYSKLNIFQNQEDLDRFTKALFEEELEGLVASCNAEALKDNKKKDCLEIHVGAETN